MEIQVSLKAMPEKTITIRAPQTDLSQGSQRTAQVAGKPTAGAAAGARPAAAAGDTVTLTATAAELLKLEDSLSGMPDVDRARVAEIKAAIADGSYRVDPEQIVDRLLGIEKELG